MKLAKTLGLVGVGIFWLLEGSAYAEEFGVHAGLNFAQQTNAPSGLTSSGTAGSNVSMGGQSQRVGYASGVFWEAPLAGFLKLQPELNYVQRGFSQSFSYGLSGSFGSPGSTWTAPGSGTVYGVVDYLEVPLLLKAKFDLGAFHPFIFGGPSLAIAVNREFIADRDGLGAAGDATGAYKNFDYGVYGGFGGELQLSYRTSLYFDARYYRGLCDVDPGGSGIRNQGMLVNAGFAWRGW